MIVWSPIRRNVFAGFVALGLMLFTLNAAALTNVSGKISSNTTWDLAGRPYVISSLITIDVGAVLAIAPGVIVKGYLK